MMYYSWCNLTLTHAITHVSLQNIKTMTFYLFFVVFISFHVGRIIPWWNNGLFCSPLYLYIFTCVLTSCNGILTFSILWLTTQNILFRLHNKIFRQFSDYHSMKIFKVDNIFFIKFWFNIVRTHISHNNQ